MHRICLQHFLPNKASFFFSLSLSRARFFVTIFPYLYRITIQIPFIQFSIETCSFRIQFNIASLCSSVSFYLVGFTLPRFDIRLLYNTIFVCVYWRYSCMPFYFFHCRFVAVVVCVVNSLIAHRDRQKAYVQLCVYFWMCAYNFSYYDDFFLFIMKLALCVSLTLFQFCSILHLCFCYVSNKIHEIERRAHYLPRFIVFGCYCRCCHCVFDSYHCLFTCFVSFLFVNKRNKLRFSLLTHNTICCYSFRCA